MTIRIRYGSVKPFAKEKSMTPVRSALCSAALGYVGATGITYEADIAGPEVASGDLARADAIATMSGCELLWHALVRATLTGLDAAPYVTGAAFRDLDRVAGRAKRTATLATPPQPGDAIVWGPSAGAVAHVDACVVLDLSGRPPGVPCTVLTLVVVAGGQRDADGGETVTRLTRVLRWQGSSWVDTANGRHVLAVVDADVLGELYPLPDLRATLPTGVAATPLPPLAATP